MSYSESKKIGFALPHIFRLISRMAIKPSEHKAFFLILEQSVVEMSERELHMARFGKYKINKQ